MAEQSPVRKSLFAFAGLKTMEASARSSVLGGLLFGLTIWMAMGECIPEIVPLLMLIVLMVSCVLGIPAMRRMNENFKRFGMWRTYNSQEYTRFFLQYAGRLALFAGATAITVLIANLLRP